MILKYYNQIVHKSKAVLFGGATGADSRFSINSDTYVFYVESKKWLKLERKNIKIKIKKLKQLEVFLHQEPHIPHVA